MSETPMSRSTVFLIISLIANALLVGFVLGGGLGAKQGGERADRGPNVGQEMGLARSIERSLPKAEREEVRQAFRKAFSETRPQRRAIVRARRELVRLIRSEPYDQAAIDDAFSELREAEGESKARLHLELSKQLSNLSVEDRRAILRELSERRDRPPPPGRDRMQDPNR